MGCLADDDFGGIGWLAGFAWLAQRWGGRRSATAATTLWAVHAMLSEHPYFPPTRACRLKHWALLLEQLCVGCRHFSCART